MRHLFENRTGLLAQEPIFGQFKIRIRLYLQLFHEDILLNDNPLTYARGKRYNCCQANGDLVAMVVEQATGRHYVDCLSTELLKLIGARGWTIWVNRESGVAHLGYCMLVPAEVVLQLGLLLMQESVWDGQRLLPEGYVNQMTMVTPQYDHVGLSVYVAGKYAKRRGVANPDGFHRDTPTLHKEPYLAQDLFLLDSKAHQVVCNIRPAKMVNLHTGRRPAKVHEVDNTILPNTLIRDLVSQFERSALVA